MFNIANLRGIDKVVGIETLTSVGLHDPVRLGALWAGFKNLRLSLGKNQDRFKYWFETIKRAGYEASESNIFSRN